MSAPTTARERAAALCVAGATISGFTVSSAKRIDELDADAYVLHHEESGARLLYLACEDDNKAFSIGFKTPPANDTGVFHILEHSVLCGSRKFPVKEPFVDLIKSSMQTFLNAMTYPDKTIYPVASTNEQDLLNLMDVYLDAVLNPAIYTKPAIFQQEGWHYELDVAQGADLRDGTLRYNGVVYNEMKGALSDPTDVLDNAVGRALFPDTAYAFESGGDPRAIPQLTYEDFLDTHARHYAASNSYITLYGNLDAERFLTFLNNEYLSDEARKAGRDLRARAAGVVAEHPGMPNPLRVQEPVTCPYLRVPMVTSPDNALVGLAYTVGDAQDRKRMIAADVLLDALTGSNEAPVKKAVLAAGLGGDLSSYTMDHCQQPYQLLILQSAGKQCAQAFRDVVEGTCRDLVDRGIPRDRLEATLSSNEYALRQRDYGMADGVVLACTALTTWLYEDSDEAATRALEYADIYRELRLELEGDYFENLLRELVLDSDHSALIDLVPCAPGELDVPSEAARLEAIKVSLSDMDLEAVVADEQALRLQQETPDSDEARARLPRLHASDIGDALAEAAPALDHSTPLPCLRHAIPTRQLAYALYYFDISHLSFAELPYAAVLAGLLQQLDTEQHSAAELDSFIGSNLGFMSARCEVFSQPNPRLARPVLTVAAGALSEKVERLASIPREVWAHTLFDDTGRIRDVLTQMRIGMEQLFINSGHAAALARARSYVSPASVAGEQLSGVDFYRFVRDLLDHFDERADALVGTLRDLQSRIFTSTGTVVSFTGSDEDYARFWQAAGDLGLAARTAPAKELYVPAPEPKHEAFIIPSDVCFVARACDPRLLGIESTGTWNVAANALSYDYLWNEIRVKGGAYGCGFRFQPDNSMGFYTYRDPAIDPSLARIAAAGAWLSSFEPDAETFEGFQVSCVASLDAPLKPFALTRRQDSTYLSRREPTWREQLRAEVLSSTPEGLRALGEEVERVSAEAPLCVFGGRDIIEASAAELVPIELMG